VRENFQAYFMLGFVELGESKNKKFISNCKQYLKATEIEFENYRSIEKLALDFATKTESLLYELSNEQIGREYTKKYRDLFVGLKNYQNTKLRLDLLQGIIKRESFVTFGKDQLIPESVLKKREQK